MIISRYVPGSIPELCSTECWRGEHRLGIHACRMASLNASFLTHCRGSRNSEWTDRKAHRQDCARDSERFGDVLLRLYLLRSQRDRGSGKPYCSLCRNHARIDGNRIMTCILDVFHTTVFYAIFFPLLALPVIDHLITLFGQHGHLT